MSDDAPLVTVATPSLNRGESILEAIESALSQSYPRIEYIVMDRALGCFGEYGVRLGGVPSDFVNRSCSSSARIVQGPTTTTRSAARADEPPHGANGRSQLLVLSTPRPSGGRDGTPAH